MLDVSRNSEEAIVVNIQKVRGNRSEIRERAEVWVMHCPVKCGKDFEFCSE